MATTGAQSQTEVQITIDDKDPQDALKQFEEALNEGKNPIFSSKTAKIVQKHVEKAVKKNPEQTQITLSAKEGNVILEGILKANAAGLNVALSPEAKDALTGLLQADYRTFAQARVEAKKDFISLMRLQQLMTLGFVPFVKEEEKKTKSLIAGIQKIQSKEKKPLIIQSGSVHRDWAVFKEGTEKLGMNIALAEEAEEETQREARRQAFLQVLATESHILDLSNFPKDKQIVKAQQLAPYGVKCILSVKALKGEPITIASFNPHHALESFEMALSQGFVPQFDNITQQLVNQYYFNSQSDFHLVSFKEKDPKKLLTQMQQALNHGLALQLGEDQKAMLRDYLVTQPKKNQLVLLGFRGVNKHNLQLAQDIGIKVDVTKIDKTQLPLEPIMIQLAQKQIKGGFFSKAKRVPDLETTLDEATRLAKLGVRMKLSSDVNLLLNQTQEKLRAEMNKIKDKKKGKLSKEGEAAKHLLEKYKIMDLEMKRANTPVSFNEFETKPVENKTSGVSHYQDLQRQQASNPASAETQESTVETLDPTTKPEAKP